MVGLVIVAHGNMGEELLRVAEMIVGKVDNASAVSVGSMAEVDRARDEVGAALKRADAGDGVLVLTDMFGGTPSNLALSFLDENKVEVLTGVNLPMVIKFAGNRKDKSLADLVNIVKESGLKSIIVANEMLRGKAK